MIIEANTFSKGVYFILNGEIHVMDSQKLFRYTTLSEGSFFGEMSLLGNELNEYSYCYNYYEKPAVMLFIDGDQFLQICNDHKGESLFLKKIAKHRKSKFNKFKKSVLMSHIKAVF